jgi:hypothetical protein
MDILWQHLWSLYDSKVSLASRSDGLFMLKKLSKEHLDLTSYSRMRVHLAVEVCYTLLNSFNAKSVLLCLYYRYWVIRWPRPLHFMAIQGPLKHKGSSKTLTPSIAWMLDIQLNTSSVRNPILSHTQARMMRDSLYVNVMLHCIRDFCVIVHYLSGWRKIS